MSNGEDTDIAVVFDKLADDKGGRSVFVFFDYPLQFFGGINFEDSASLATGAGFYNQRKAELISNCFKTGVVENDGGDRVIEFIFGLFFVFRG